MAIKASAEKDNKKVEDGKNIAKGELVASLTLEDGKSSKIWKAYKISPHITTVQFGKIGTDGRTDAPKQHDDEDAADKFLDKLVASKKKKGYA